MAESTSTTDFHDGGSAAAAKLEPSLEPTLGVREPEAETPEPREKTGFGAALRAAREAQSISLGDMAVQCRLAVAQLRALEEEKLENLPEPVYVRAFIRGYAQSLKLDPAPLVEDYMTRYGRRGAAVEIGQLPARSPSSETVFHEAPRNGAFKAVVLVVIAALLIGGIWAVYTDQFSSLHSSSEAQKIEEGASEVPAAAASPDAAAKGGEASQGAPAAPADGSQAPLQAPQTSGDRPQEPAPAAPAQPAPATQAPAPAAAAAAQAQAPAEAARVHKVEFRVGAGSSWVQVIAPTGRNVIAAEMRAQSTQTYDVPNGSRFTIGNAGVVSLTIDGEPYSLEHTVRNGIARFTIE